MTENEKKEYVQRYETLQNLLLNAYVDVFSLNEIGKFNETRGEDDRVLFQSSSHVIGHIIDLLKADLALTVWKLYSDPNPKANTIKHLGNFIKKTDNNKAYCVPKMSLSNSIKDIEKKLTTLRNTYLAHNDSAIQSVSIPLSDLECLVEDLRTKLNSMCFEQIDTGITEITNKHLNSIKFDVSFGLGLMLRRSTFPIVNQANNQK